MNKKAIKKFAIDARNKLIASVSDRAGMLGITPEGCSEPLSKGADFEVFQTAAGTEVTLNRNQCEQRGKLVAEIKASGFEAVVEEVAYTWFNRICAIRFMEVNDYLPTRVRVLSSEKAGKSEPDIVTYAPEIDLDFTEQEKEYIIELKLKSDSESQDALFRFLFIKQCNKLHDVLPELFEETSDYTEMLLDISYTNQDEIVSMLVNNKDGMSETDFNISSVDENGEPTGQVEIIGWLYQYYISEKHDQIVNINKGSIKKEDIPAATQLFTTDWVVRYMVDNSLGRYWIERNPESKLADKLQFYVTSKNGHIEYVDEKIDPTELTFFDPCMGSGHILVYAFDVLMEIYRECGYSDRDAALNIVQFNLFGLDIDKRAYQLAYFAVMMKARSYNRRALVQRVFNNVSAIEESNSIQQFHCEGITDNKEQNKIGDYLVKAFLHAREIGSLQTIEEYDYKTFAEYLLNLERKEVQLDMFSSGWIRDTLPMMLHLTKQAAILSRKYKVVCTNPPYMNKMEGYLKKFVVDNYKDYSGDLFSVFMYRNFDFCVKNGYSAFMTPFVWMFIKTHEKLRQFILDNKRITSLVQMEYSAFEEATVPICSFVFKNGYDGKTGYYIKLTEFKGGMNVQKEKTLEAISAVNVDYYYESNQEDMKKLPGQTIAFWASPNVVHDFVNGRKVEELSETRIGMATANNDLFMRNWHEVSITTIGFNISSRQQALDSKKKWFPYCKGGSYRKWYGNMDYVVNWEDDGKSIRNFKDEKTGRIRSHNYNLDYIFLPGLTFTAISSSNFACRIMNYSLFGSGGSGICNISIEKRHALLGFLNSKIAEYLLGCLSLTMNFEVNTVGSLPAILDEKSESIVDIVETLIVLSQADWDSYETSWDFNRHPLLNKGNDIQESVQEWKRLNEQRFCQVKEKEEELNQLLIEIYGLQNELTATICDKDVTLHKANICEDIKSLLSYAVGCMFGRYSLDKEGLVYAGGDFTQYYNKVEQLLTDSDGSVIVTECCLAN